MGRVIGAHVIPSPHEEVGKIIKKYENVREEVKNERKSEEQ